MQSRVNTKGVSKLKVERSAYNCTCATTGRLCGFCSNWVKNHLKEMTPTEALQHVQVKQVESRALERMRLQNKYDQRSAHVSNAQVIIWKSHTHEGLRDEQYNVTKRSPGSHLEYHHGMYRCVEHVMRDTAPDFTRLLHACKPNKTPGCGFGVGMGNASMNIKLAAYAGTFKTIGDLQEYWRKIELLHNPCLDLSKKMKYEDTIKYVLVQASAGLKFCDNFAASMSFAIQQAQKNAEVMDPFALETIAGYMDHFSGVDATTPWVEGSQEMNATPRQLWTTAALIAEYKKKPQPYIYKELLRRAEPSFNQWFLDLANGKTQEQYHAFVDRIRTDTFLRSYWREAQQTQANHKFLTGWMGVYAKYREDIVQIPYNIYIYTMFTTPTAEQLIEIGKFQHSDEPGFRRKEFPYAQDATEFRPTVIPSEDNPNDVVVGEMLPDEIGEEVYANFVREMLFGDHESFTTMANGDEDGEDPGMLTRMWTSLMNRATERLVGQHAPAYTIPADQVSNEESQILEKVGLRVDGEHYIIPADMKFGDLPIAAGYLAKSAAKMSNNMEQLTDAAKKLKGEIDSTKIISNLNELVSDIKSTSGSLAARMEKMDGLLEVIESDDFNELLRRGVKKANKQIQMKDDFAMLSEPIMKYIRAFLPERIREYPTIKEMLKKFPWATAIGTFIMWNKTEGVGKWILALNFFAQLGGIKLITTILGALADKLFGEEDKSEWKLGNEWFMGTTEEPVASKTSATDTEATLLSRIWSWICEHGVTIGIVTTVLVAIAALFGCNWDSKKDPKVASDITSKVRSAGMFSGAMLNIDKFGRKIYSVLEDTYAWLYEKCTGKEYVKPDDKFILQLQEYKAVATYYTSEVGRPALVNEPTHRECATDYIKRWREFTAKLNRKGPNNEFDLAYRICGKDMTDMEKALHAAIEIHKNSPQPRHEPFVISFVGPTGAGKTTMSTKIAASFAEKLSNDRSKVFSWDPNREFADGYADQKVAMVEEVNALKKGEYMVPLLTLFSAAPFVVNMARIEEKGKPCLVEVFITTSNADKTVAEGLMCPEAFDRRRNIVIKTELKPAYKTTGKMTYRVKQGKNYIEQEKTVDVPNKVAIDKMSREQKENFEHLNIYMVDSISPSQQIDASHWVHQLRRADGQPVYEGPRQPITFKELLEIIDVGHTRHLAVQSALSGHEVYKHQVENIRAIMRSVNIAMTKPSTLYKGTCESFSTKSMRALGAMYDQLEHQVQTVNDYLKQDTGAVYEPVTIPDFKALIAAECKSFTTAGTNTIHVEIGGHSVHLAHHELRTEDVVLVPMRTLVMDPNAESRGDDYDLYISRTIMPTFTPEGGIVRVPIDVDFARFAGRSLDDDTLVWRGKGSMSITNVRDESWFKRSLSYWYFHTNRQSREMIHEYVDDVIEPIVKQSCWLIRYYRKSSRFVKENIKYLLSPITSLLHISEAFKIATTMVMSLFFAGVIWTIMFMMYKMLAPVKSHTTAGPYSNDVNSSRRAIMTALGAPSMATTSKTSATTNAMMNTEGLDIAKSHVRRNMRVVQIGMDVFNGTFVKNNCMLIPAHTVGRILQRGKIGLLDMQSGNVTEYEILPTDIITFATECDQAVMCVRQHPHMHSIIKHIPEVVDIYQLMEHGAELDYISWRPTGKMLPTHICNKVENVAPVLGEVYADGFELGHGFAFNGAAVAGSSGGPIMTFKEKEFIVAMQSGGTNRKTSWGTILKRSRIEEACNALQVIQHNPEIESYTSCTMNMVPDVEVHPIEEIPRALHDNDGNCLDVIGIIEDPAYIASPWNEVGFFHSPIKVTVDRVMPPKRVPAIMSPMDSRWKKWSKEFSHPLEHSLLKSVRGKVGVFTLEESEFAVKSVAQYVRSALQLKPGDLKTRTFEEALHDDNTRMNPTSSAGFPWKARVGGKGKENLFRFNEDGGLAFVNPDFRKEVHEQLELLKEGIVPPNTIYIFGKSELRPFEKEGKTRSIEVCSATMSVIYRMVIQDLTDRLVATADGSHPWMFGVNPASTDWTTLAKNLMSKGKNRCFGLDVKNWDGHMTYWLAMLVGMLVNELYEDENDLVRLGLVTQMMCSPLQFGPYVVKKNRGMSSGWPGTTFWNTMGHFLFGFVMYCRIMNDQGKPEWANMSAFNWFVCARYYGDDSIQSVRWEIASIYNAVTVADYYSRIGLPATPESKDQAFVPFRNLTDCTFLKRGFRYDIDFAVWHAPLDIDVIYDMVRWVRGTKEWQVKPQFISNVYDALRELLQHGREEYDLFCDTVFPAARRQGINLTYFRYSDLYDTLSGFYE